jgi:hypothetical protein
MGMFPRADDVQHRGPSKPGRGRPVHPLRHTAAWMESPGASVAVLAAVMAPVLHGAYRRWRQPRGGELAWGDLKEAEGEIMIDNPLVLPREAASRSRPPRRRARRHPCS